MSAQLTLFAAERPNLRSYDWIAVSSSAGKDSQAALDEVVRQCDAAGVDRERIVVVHCDLGRVEWPGTRELAEEHAHHYGLAFLVVSRSQGDLLDQVEARGMWPGYTTRYCTADHKRAQVARVVTALARCYTDRPAGRGAFQLPDHWAVPPRVTAEGEPVRVLDVLGLRAEESSARAKMVPFTRGKRSTATVHVDEWLPVHAWTEPEVWACVRSSGTRPHEAYALGMPRLSCVLCIYAGRDALVIGGAHNLDLLREYVRVERAIGHTFKDGLALASILEDIEAGVVVPGRAQGWAA